jgi:hypothetical protein
VVVGVLEDLPGHYVGESDFRAVRVIFHRIGGEWTAFPTQCEDQQSLKALTKSYPAEVNWTIALNGRDVGSLKTHVPDDFAWYSEIGIEKILDSGPVPTIGKQSQQYSGWNGTPVYRPLVAVSKPNFSDPDDWKRAQLTPGQVAKLRLNFRKKFPKVSNCVNPEANLPKPWKYRDDDIRMGSTYSSANHWGLAELNLAGYACDGPIDDGGPFDSQWYIVNPTGDVRYLGSGMWLVDAGDYDNDGKSEVLFAVSGYDEGGYRLYYADFRKSAKFLFNYH